MILFRFEHVPPTHSHVQCYFFPNDYKLILEHAIKYIALRTSGLIHGN